MPIALQLEWGRRAARRKYGEQHDGCVCRRIFVTTSDEDLFPCGHRRRRLRVPAEQTARAFEQGRLRTVYRQWDTHRDLRHNPDVPELISSTSF
jgi:hypothetical protein